METKYDKSTCPESQVFLRFSININGHNQPVVKDLYASEAYFVGFASGISADHDFVLY